MNVLPYHYSFLQVVVTERSLRSNCILQLWTRARTINQEESLGGGEENIPLNPFFHREKIVLHKGTIRPMQCLITRVSRSDKRPLVGLRSCSQHQVTSQ